MKKKVSEETKVRISTVDLIKSDDPVDFLSNARLVLEPENYSKVIDQIEQYPYKITNILGSKAKKTYKELDYPNLLPIPFDNELTWAKSILFRNGKYINNYIKISNNFSSQLLQGNYKAANDTLEEIENEFGQSMWLIKNKIALLQLTEGLESQKKYTQKVKENLKDRGLVKFVVHWVSIRNEGKTTLNKFVSQFEPIINRFNPEKLAGFKEYCKFHVLGNDSLDPIEFANVLRLEYSRSLIDYYEAFVSLLRVVVLTDDLKLKSKLKYLLGSKGSIQDPRLNMFASIIRDETKPIAPKESIDSFDSYLIGDYSKSYKISFDALNSFPDDPLLILLASYSKAMLTNNNVDTQETEFVDNTQNTSINNLLINNLSEVINKGTISASKEMNELSKISINFSCFPWSSIINIILSQEHSIFPSANSEGNLSVLKVPYYHPFLVGSTTGSSVYDLYFNACKIQYKNTLSIEYIISKSGESSNLSAYKLFDEAKSFLNGVLNFNNQNYKEAINCGLKLSKSKHNYYIRKGIGLVSHSHLMMGHFHEACISSVEYYLKDKQNFTFLPLSELYREIKSGTDQWDQINHLIDFPIILDAFVKHIDVVGETERRFAYEDFLLKNGISRPSELKSIANKFDQNKLIYYLKYICIETNMDTSDAFEGGSNEIISERLAVCKLLVEIDPTNSKEYQKEINEIVRKQIIISRRLEVDQSRIYIDIEKVKEWSKNNLEESYDRYIAYRKYGLDFDEPEKETKKKTKTTLSEFATLPNILIPQDEVKGLLKDIVEEIISAYLSPEFGLDRFLSTRIRHGILENHLRKPLAKYDLVTKKESKNGRYLSNEYWLKKLKISSPNISNDFDKIFASFSRSYDNMILKLTSELLQVKSEKKPKGLFDFHIVEEDIDTISKTINHETKFSEFIDIVINLLETVLIFKLADIRTEFYKIAKPNAKLYLKEMQEKISKYSTTNTTELHSSINQARTDMQAQFDKAIEWFVPSASGNSSPFDVEDPIRVAETFITDNSPNFKINLEKENLLDFAIHGNLPIFVDIFINIFDNIVKRSGVANPIAECKAWRDESIPDLNIVHFEIINEVILQREVREVEIELERKKKLLESGNYTNYVATEGDSGLFKIHKSISELRAVGFSQKATMNFKLVDSKFYFQISIPFRVFKLESEEELITK